MVNKINTANEGRCQTIFNRRLNKFMKGSLNTFMKGSQTIFNRRLKIFMQGQKEGKDKRDGEMAQKVWPCLKQVFRMWTVGKYMSRMSSFSSSTV